MSLGAGETGYYKAYSKRASWTFMNSVIWKYEYTNAYAQLTLPLTGTYRIECWGGGYPTESISYYGRNCAGYVAGDISLNQNTDLYIYVGRMIDSNPDVYSFNGGGAAHNKANSWGYNGGGGTDVRMTKHNDTSGWGRSDAVSLRSRIIVAGGGGAGGLGQRVKNTGSAGGLDGYDSDHSTTSGGANADYHCGKGGHQTSGGSRGSMTYGEWGTSGGFGYGGEGGRSTDSGSGNGGGGGWYGAGGANGAGSGSYAAGGGSSFISGHYGCNGINSSGTHQGASNPSKVLFNRESGEHTITFTNTKMIDGGGYRWDSSGHSTKEQMPNPAGGYYATGQGHWGHGYCKITYTRQ